MATEKHEIEINETTPEVNSKKLACLQSSGEWLAQSTKTVVLAEAIAFICANATFDLLVMVSEGYPTLARDIAKNLAIYQIPAVAISAAIVETLNAMHISKAPTAHRALMSSMSAVGVTTFAVPLVMQIITRAVQIAKQQPRNTPVDISNLEAWLVIGACAGAGLIQGVQTHYLQHNTLEPDAAKSWLNRITTGKIMLPLSAIVKSASSIHGLTYAIQGLFWNTENTIPYYSRLAMTVGAGALGGIILGRANPQTRADAKLFNAILTISQLTALSITFANTFYISPHAASLFGEATIDEQTWLWAALIPFTSTVLILLQLAGLKGPQLFKALCNIISEAMQTTEPERKPILPYARSENSFFTPAELNDPSAAKSTNEPYSINLDLE